MMWSGIRFGGSDPFRRSRDPFRWTRCLEPGSEKTTSAADLDVHQGFVRRQLKSTGSDCVTEVVSV